ncbi:hypothetical protein SLEP1_g43656 [Rubroshorea leprosula]|uniref:Flavin-containing monooxygenase n=1 Tax=Rubroshorea leprosula TaxID=152421 RepID=A0AAV5LFA8_9ROSI|nr:hypothetical protein SLEP1_g43656 [Rubroshorea leprosula]
MAQIVSVPVLIVGAGPSGLAISACLNNLSISNTVLERENCYGSLWKHRCYDRVSLHLAKQFCELPLHPHSPTTPKYMPKATFLAYLDEYVSKFNINPRYNRHVESAEFDESIKSWRVEAKNLLSEVTEVYVAEFLVVATGENSEGVIPQIPGLDTFPGEILHSSLYKSGKQYEGKNVLVVGCGNSGMEISLDLSNFGARTTIVARNPIHVLSKEMVYTGMFLLKHLGVGLVDRAVTWLSTLKFGDLTKYGIRRPTEGPFYLKGLTGRSPTIDAGTVAKIKAGEVKVAPEISHINANLVTFRDGKVSSFDAIILATGYKSSANKWLKDFKYILNNDGLPKQKQPDHWKGDNGIYCIGLSKNGLFGIARDAKEASDDIFKTLKARE